MAMMVPPPPPAEFLHVKPGKGAAFVRSKLKNFITGNTVGGVGGPPCAGICGVCAHVAGKGVDAAAKATAPHHGRMVGGSGREAACVHALHSQAHCPPPLPPLPPPPHPPPDPPAPPRAQVEKTWRAGESVELASVEKKETQFTYAEGDEVGLSSVTHQHPHVVQYVLMTRPTTILIPPPQHITLTPPPPGQYVFMDMTSYEETRIPRDDDWAKYLKEGMDVGVLLWNGKVGHGGMGVVWRGVAWRGVAWVG